MLLFAGTVRTLTLLLSVEGAGDDNFAPDDRGRGDEAEEGDPCAMDEGATFLIEGEDGRAEDDDDDDDDKDASCCCLEGEMWLLFTVSAVFFVSSSFQHSFTSPVELELLVCL